MPQRHIHYDLPPAKTRWEHTTHWLHRWWPWIVVVLVSVLLVGRSQLQAEQLSDTVVQVQALTKENRQLTTSLQSAIVESCVENGNAARLAARETLQEEIHEARNPDPEVLKAFNLPPEKIEALLDQNVQKLERRLDRVQPVNCAKQYQISPGSGDRRRDRKLDSSTP